MYKEGGKIYLKQPKRMDDGGGIKTDYFDRELPYRPELNPAMDMGNYQIGHGLNYGGMGDIFNTSKSNVANSDPANIPYRRTSEPTPPPTTKSGGPFIGPPPMEPLDPNGLGSGTGSPFNLGTSLLNNAGNLYQLGNAIFNQDDTSVVNNKFQDKAMGLMEGRRYNAKPELDANKSSVAGANYALKNSGTQNGSEVRSRLTDVLRSKFTADSRVLANKQNMDNGYMGEEAQMKNQMGEYNRNEDIRVNTANEQNRANRQDMIGSSLSSMGRNTQMQMNDQTRIDLLPSLFPGMGTDGNEILKMLLGRK